MSIHLGNKSVSLESGLYYTGGRYYSPIMKSFISSCNIDEILYNIDVPGNLNPYSIGNPMYFPLNGYNIFTSIPLVPENIGSGGGSDFWRVLGNIGRFIGGLAIVICGVAVMASLVYLTGPLVLFPGAGTLFTAALSLTMYGGYMMASSWDSQVKADMDRIGWNPFNTNADMSGVNKVSFYKGQPVMLHNSDFSSFSIGIMFLKESQKKNTDAVKHEWGHFAQLLIVGPTAYMGFVAIPSVINFEFGEYNNYIGPERERMYYSKIWERTADWLGGVNRNNYDPFWSWSNFVPW